VKVVQPKLKVVVNMNVLKRIVRNERGLALPAALVLLILGAFLVVPTAMLLSTDLLANNVAERNTAELYASDSGVEYAVWRLKNDYDLALPEEGGAPIAITFPETLNDKTVSVELSKPTGMPYKITSVATSGSGEQTTVTAYVSVDYYDLAWMFDNAITSPNDVELNNNTVIGDIQYNGMLVMPDPSTVTHIGNLNTETIDWPNTQALIDYYWQQVDHLTPVPDGYVIDVSSGTEDNPILIGPLSGAGDVEIQGDGYCKIVGTIYTKGVFSTKTQVIGVQLNSQTIFSEYNGSHNAIYIPPNVTVTGSGCLIAVGDINFQPNLDCTPDDFIFIMSVEGRTWLKPGGIFYGSIAGDTKVDVQPGTIIEKTTVPDGGLNFPSGDDGGNNAVVEFVDIHSYDIE
jgi:hypothetical protein